MKGVARVVAGVAVVFVVAYQMVANQAPQGTATSSPPLFVADRTTDDLAKEHPEPAIPGHYPESCVAGQHRWVTPVQGYVMDWCAIELHLDGRGHAAVTAYIDSPVQRGFMETAQRRD
jgi:hypothetical protein